MVGRPDQHKHDDREDHAQVEHCDTVVDLASADLEKDGHQDGLQDEVRHAHDHVDVQLLDLELEGVDESLEHEDIEDRLRHKVARLLAEVLSELGRRISTLPLTRLEIHQKLGPLHKLVLVVQGCLLYDGPIVPQLLKDSLVKLVTFEHIVVLRIALFVRLGCLEFFTFSLRDVALVLTG